MKVNNLEYNNLFFLRSNLPFQISSYGKPFVRTILATEKEEDLIYNQCFELKCNIIKRWITADDG